MLNQISGHTSLVVPRVFIPSGNALGARVDRESTRVCCRLRALLCVQIVMTVHSDTTCESARCLHADGFHNHTSNGLSHAQA